MGVSIKKIKGDLMKPPFLISIRPNPKQIPSIPNWSLWSLRNRVANQEIQLYVCLGSSEIEDPIYAIS
jgi:hypothetical protein